MNQEAISYNKSLAKLIQSLKKDIGAVSVRQGYHGTGEKSHRRQIWVSFSNNTSTDLWLEKDRLEIGGVMSKQGHIAYKGRPPEEVYAELKRFFITPSPLSRL